MFKIEGNTIHLTRGDIAVIEISTVDESTGNDYVFKAGDVVQLTVFAKKEHEKVVLQKEVTVQEANSTAVVISLSEEETTIGDAINKPVEYWYDVELNPETAPQTVIGYDDVDGAKKFILYPKGGDA